MGVFQLSDKQVADFDRDGYVWVEGPFDKQEIAVLCSGNDPDGSWKPHARPKGPRLFS